MLKNTVVVRGSLCMIKELIKGEGAVTGEPVLPHHGTIVGQFILWDNGGWTVGPIQG